MCEQTPRFLSDKQCYNSMNSILSRTFLPDSLGKNLIVGKDCTDTSSTSFAVESILAIMIEGWSLYFSPETKSVKN